MLGNVIVELSTL